MSRDIGDSWRLSGADGLVAAVGVQVEVSDESVVDEDAGVAVGYGDVGWLTAVAAADLGQPMAGGGGAVWGGSGGGGVGGWPGVGWWGGFVGGCPTLVGGDAVDASVGPLAVVVVDELIELGLQLGQGAGWAAAGSEPLFEGLLEPFDLAAGLGMERLGGD